MANERTVGRTMAALLLLQMTGGYVVNFVLLAPLTAPGGYLANAAAHSLALGVGVVAGLATSAIQIAIALVAWPVFRRESEAAGLCYLAAAVAGFCLGAVEYQTVLSMSSLSQAYAAASDAERVSFAALGAAVGAARRWAHYSHVITSGAAGLVLFSVSFRYRLVPRPLAGFGIAAALLLLVALARPLFGQPIVFPLLAPMGLAQLALVLWLFAKGLRAAT